MSHMVFLVCSEITKWNYSQLDCHWALVQMINELKIRSEKENEKFIQSPSVRVSNIERWMSNVVEKCKIPACKLIQHSPIDTKWTLKKNANKNSTSSYAIISSGEFFFLLWDTAEYLLVFLRLNFSIAWLVCSVSTVWSHSPYTKNKSLDEITSG